MVFLKGMLSVASSHKLVSVTRLDIKEHEVVIFDFSDTVYIDDSAAMVVGQLPELAAVSGTECIVRGLGEDFLTPVPARSGDLRAMPPSMVSEVTGRTFFWARTIKVPYLTAEEAERLARELRQYLEADV